MGAMNIVRIIVQVIATLITLVGIGLVAAGLLSSGWQIMIDPGVGEIHQHGLWMDYVYSNRMHIAGVPAPFLGGPGTLAGYGYSGLSALESGSWGSGYNGYGGDNYYGYMAPGGQWIMTYKFGDAVYGDPAHRAQPYQIYALVLLVLALVFALIGVIFSYCAGVRVAFSIIWAVLLFFAVVLGAAGLIQFYVEALMPQYRFAYTDRMLRQFVGYSYWWSTVGIIALAVGMIGSVGTAVLVGVMNRNGRDDKKPASTPTIVFKPANDNVVYTTKTNDIYYTTKRPGATTPV